MNFDYLIIGAGSAGCVLANRLTENDQNNVAIFEAGKPSDIWKVNMPLAILYTMHDPKYNYKYYSEPEPCLLYTSPSPRDAHESRMPSSA